MKTLVFENFKLLKEDMLKNDWVIEAFNFRYKNTRYIVLAKLYHKNEQKPKYSLLKTEIINATNANNSIIIPVNSNGFMTNARTLREFFNIEYSENLGDILCQFNQYFSKFIPTKVNPNKSELLTQSMVYSLSISDSEDPEKIFCYTVRRNSNSANRTSFNDNKTKILRPNLYMKFKDESKISFCYSLNENDEKSDEEILLNFSKRK